MLSLEELEALSKELPKKNKRKKIENPFRSGKIKANQKHRYWIDFPPLRYSREA
jgi:hypothetical protein